MSEKIQKKMIRTASMKSKGCKYPPAGETVTLLCFVFEATTGKGSTGATVQVQLSVLYSSLSDTVTLMQLSFKFPKMFYCSADTFSSDQRFDPFNADSNILNTLEG